MMKKSFVMDENVNILLLKALNNISAQNLTQKGMQEKLANLRQFIQKI